MGVSAKRSGTPAAAILALVLSACGSPDGDGSAPGNNTSAGFRPPPVAAPSPLPGLAQKTPLAAYVGRYPSDPIEGVLFLDRTEAATALADAVGDPAVRKTVAAGGTEVPIFRTATHVALHACEPHNCADRNWTLLVPVGDALPALCFHDAAVSGAGSRWYEGAAPTTRPGDCPTA